MTGNEVKAMKDDVLATELASLRDKLYRIRTQTATEKVEDVSQFGKVRRDIARILTEQRSRRAPAAAKPAAAAEKPAAKPAKAPKTVKAAKAPKAAGAKPKSKSAATK